jgi:anaerobic selenocysteine-containing dehydrogenase
MHSSATPATPTAPSTVFRTCNLCEAMCGLAITLDGGRIADIRADKEDVFSRGHICPKGPAMREVLEDPDRIRRPMRRIGSGSEWKEISWTDAFDEVGSRLGEVRARHGRDAIGLYVGNPTVHNHGALLAIQGFSRALGTKNRFDANSQDANPKLFASLAMFGDLGSITIPDVDRTDYFLVLGANPAASMGSVMTLGDVRGRMTDVRSRGGKIVLFDPRRTETAAWCDAHHFIRPGGDAALLLAILHELFGTKRVNEAALAKTVRGVAALRDLAARFPPERVAACTGVAPAVVRQVARDFAAAERAVCYGRVGTCQNEFGPVASWLVEAINVVTGNFDRPGGAMFTKPAADLASLGRRFSLSKYGRWRSRVRGLPELGGQLPAAVMAEEIETPGPGQIRGFVTVAGNPVLSVPNGERLARSFSSLDCMVAIDYYLNETTRHAHVILPPVHALERPHFDLVFNALAVRNTVKYSEVVVPPDADARDDFSILYELGMRLGGMRFGHPAIDQAAKGAWKLGWRISPDTILDLAIRLGPHGDRFGARRGLNLKKVRAKPHGIDLGPLTPCAAERVRTKDRRVDVAPEIFLADIPRLEEWIGRGWGATGAREPRGADAATGTEDDPLVLIGRRHLRTNNSWMHNVRSLVKGPDRATLLVNLADAHRLRLTAGQEVRVTSRVGSVTVKVTPTEDIMPGVVSLPHGYGHAAAAETMKIAGATPGPNVNALTDDLFVEPILGTAILNGVPVTIEAL